MAEFYVKLHELLQKLSNILSFDTFFHYSMAVKIILQAEKEYCCFIKKLEVNYLNFNNR